MSAFFVSAPSVLVAGSQTVSGAAFARVGTITAGGRVTLSATLSTSDPLVAAELRLSDALTGVPIPGSTVASTSTRGEVVSVAVALGAAALLALELRAAGVARASCTAADVAAG